MSIAIQHLRKFWTNAIVKAIDDHHRVELKEELKEIDSRLCVSVNMSDIVRSQDKLFSLTRNYPNENGDAFHDHMEEHHPDSLLISVLSMKGNRQDLIVQRASATYVNRAYYVEFLDKRLQAYKKNKILEEKSYITLTSNTMVACLRCLSIVHYPIVVPMRWLSGNLHALSKHNWSVRSMGRLLDVLNGKMENLSAKPTKLVDESFVMTFFILSRKNYLLSSST